MTSQSDRYDSICHYNPTADRPEVDDAQDCARPAAWHFLARQGDSGGVEAYQSCDAHQGDALQLDGVEEFHEFGSACGLERSYWMSDSSCATEETLVEAGLAWYEITDQNAPPSHPLPGTYIREMDTGYWRRFVDGLWVEVEAPPGARV